MDINEMITQQLTSNPQLAGQLMQMLMQSGGNSSNQGNQQRQNWNMPTNPMASMWWNFMNSMNNQNNQRSAQNQQSNQSNTQQTNTTQQQQPDGRVSFVRIIKSPDEIRPDEVPMSGDIRLFLQEDLSTIYGKRWTNNGTVENLRFILEKNDQNEVRSSNDSSNKIPTEAALFEKISEMIDEKLNHLFGESNDNKKGVEHSGD